MIAILSTAIFLLPSALQAQTRLSAAEPSAVSSPALAKPQSSRARVQDDNSPEAGIKLRKNAFTVGIASGQLEGLYPRFASELQKVLDDGDNLRVLPYLAYGAASNIEDLLYLRGVDVAFTQSDVLEYYKTQLKTPNLAERISYILRLYNTEIHILAGPDIKSVDDLRGKKVSFGPAGNSAALTGPVILQRLNVPVEQLLLDHSTGLDKLKKGEISAIVRVVGKPVDFFTKIPAGSGLHFLPVPSRGVLDDIYTPAELNSVDYPTLVGKGEVVETISVPTILAVYNWAPGTDRYRRVQRFVEGLFTKWDKLQADPFHPKWREINLSADVAGWKRSPLAETMLRQLALTTPDDQKNFNAFLDRADPHIRADSDREKLFKDYLAWRAHSSSPSAK